MEITEAEVGCGCLTPHLDQRAFRPGESGNLALEVNTAYVAVPASVQTA